MWKSCKKKFGKEDPDIDEFIKILEKIKKNKKVYTPMSWFFKKFVYYFSIGTYGTNATYDFFKLIMPDSIINSSSKDFPKKITDTQILKYIIEIALSMLNGTNLILLNIIEFEKLVGESFLRHLFSIKFTGDFNEFENKCDEIFNKEFDNRSIKEWMKFYCNIGRLLIDLTYMIPHAMNLYDLIHPFDETHEQKFLKKMEKDKIQVLLENEETIKMIYRFLQIHNKITAGVNVIYNNGAITDQLKIIQLKQYITRNVARIRLGDLIDIQNGNLHRLYLHKKQYRMKYIQFNIGVNASFITKYLPRKTFEDIIKAKEGSKSKETIETAKKLKDLMAIDDIKDFNNKSKEEFKRENILKYISYLNEKWNDYFTTVVIRQLYEPFKLDPEIKPFEIDIIIYVIYFGEIPQDKKLNLSQQAQTICDRIILKYNPLIIHGIYSYPSFDIFKLNDRYIDHRFYKGLAKKYHGNTPVIAVRQANKAVIPVAVWVQQIYRYYSDARENYEIIIESDFKFRDNLNQLYTGDTTDKIIEFMDKMKTGKRNYRDKELALTLGFMMHKVPWYYFKYVAYPSTMKFHLELIFDRDKNFALYDYTVSMIGHLFLGPKYIAKHVLVKEDPYMNEVYDDETFKSIIDPTIDDIIEKIIEEPDLVKKEDEIKGKFEDVLVDFDDMVAQSEISKIEKMKDVKIDRTVRTVRTVRTGGSGSTNGKKEIIFEINYVQNELKRLAVNNNSYINTPREHGAKMGLSMGKFMDTSQTNSKTKHWLHKIFCKLLDTGMYVSTAYTNMTNITLVLFYLSARLTNIAYKYYIENLKNINKGKSVKSENQFISFCDFVSKL